MSPNNLILVAHLGGRSYVFPGADADAHWSEAWARQRIGSAPPRPRLVRRRRGAALVLAHDLQRRLRTEYGVREVFL